MKNIEKEESNDSTEKNESVVNRTEHVIITPSDIRASLYNYEPEFYCPKCDSSLIYMPEEYAKNNLMNQMQDKQESDDNPLTIDAWQLNEHSIKWRKLVVKCDACQYTDLIGKFLKSRVRDEVFSPIGGTIPFNGGSYPRQRHPPYYTTGISKDYIKQQSKSKNNPSKAMSSKYYANKTRFK